MTISKRPVVERSIIAAPKRKLGALCVRAVLQYTADVQKRKAKLEYDQCIRTIAPAPDDPEHVAREEQPEAPVAFELSLRANHPGRDDGHHHRRPLKPIKHLESSLTSVPSMVRPTPHAAVRAAQSVPLTDERSYRSCRNALPPSLHQSSHARDATGTSHSARTASSAPAFPCPC